MFFKTRNFLIATTIYMLSPLLCAAQQVANEHGAHFISFRVGECFQTFPMSVNDSLTVTGYYIDQAGAREGFIRNPDGKLTTFAVAGSTVTSPVAINAAGEIAGSSVSATGISYGFVRYPNGYIATFNPSSRLHLVTAINKEGTIVGNYSTTDTVPPLHGFVRKMQAVPSKALCVLHMAL